MKHKLFNNQSSKDLTKGQAAEAFACKYLQEKGLRLITKNFHSRFGEIDIIMQEENSLVFIEVRYRKNQDFGGAKASITPGKQKKIRNTALLYMQKKGHEFNARFDVIAITGEENNLITEWIQNAF